MKKILFLFLIGLFFCSQVCGQEDWKAKDFDKWDARDVEAILNNSSWVRKQEVRLSYEATIQSIAGSGDPNVSNAGTEVSQGIQRDATNTVNQGSIQPAVDFTFTVRLRSSMAIRLALIRKNQLETDTKSMTKEQLENFSKKQRGLFDCPACAENYVVTLSSKSKQNKNFDAIYTSFGNARLADIKRYIFLQNDKGEKRELVHFVAPKAPGDEAIFFFKRFDDQSLPLFNLTSKYLVLNLTKDEVNQITNFKIETAPLIVGDKIDF